MEDVEMTTTSYGVAGLTCGACIAEVMEHVRALVGVTGFNLTGERADETGPDTARIANGSLAGRPARANAILGGAGS